MKFNTQCTVYTSFFFTKHEFSNKTFVMSILIKRKHQAQHPLITSHANDIDFRPSINMEAIEITLSSQKSFAYMIKEHRANYMI